MVEPSKLANEVDLQKRLWDNSAKIVQISESEDEEKIETLNSNLKEAAPTETVEKVVEEVPKPSEIKEKDSSSSEDEEVEAEEKPVEILQPTPTETVEEVAKPHVTTEKESSSSSEDEQEIKSTPYEEQETIVIDDVTQDDIVIEPNQEVDKIGPVLVQEVIAKSDDDNLVEVEEPADKEEKIVEPEVVELSDSSESEAEEIKEVPKDEPKVTEDSIQVVEPVESSSSSDEEESKVVKIESDSEDNATKGIRDEIENFKKDSLQSVETIEKIAVPDPEVINQEKELIEAETVENKEMFGKVTEELLDRGKEELNKTETIEQNTLPDKYDILKEKLEDSLIQDVETFDKTTLKTTTTHESETFQILQRQDSIKKNIESFDLGQLKPAETEEKVSLPNSEIIAQERQLIVQEIDLNKEIYGQVTEQIKLQKEVLNKTEVVEQNTLPDKYDILKEKLEGSLIEGVESFDKTTLKTTTTHESETLQILQRQDSIKKNIEDFDLGTLKSAEVDEKIVLPSQQVIEAEREFIAQEIETNKETFTKTVLQKLESFDATTELKHVENIEESDVQVIKDAYIQEKSHQKLMDELSAFEESNLSHVKTLEPMTPTDVAKTELLRSNTLEGVTSFDKTTLKTTLTEEKVVLPDTKAISMVNF